MVFSALVTGTIFTYLLNTVSPAEIIELIGNAAVKWLTLFVLFSFSQNLFRTWRYHIILKTSGYRPDLIALYLITLVRGVFSDLLPARLGTLIYIFLVQTRLGIPFGPAASSFAYSFLFDIFSLTILILFAIVIPGYAAISPFVLTLIAVGLTLAGIIILIMLPSILKMTAELTSALPLVSASFKLELRKALIEAGQNMKYIREQGIFWQVMILSLGVRCSKYLSLYVLLLALVLPLGFSPDAFPLPKVFLGLCSAELAASLPVSGIAGFGAYEGAWAFVFQLLGYPERIAVLTGISHHLLTQVYGYSLGGFALLILLLPWFKKTVVQETSNKKLQGNWFGVKCAATIAGIIGLAGLIQVGIPAKDNSGIEPHAGYSAIIQKQNPPATLRGRLLFQRPDGIYVKNLNNKPRRIVPYGYYPRWSPDGRYIAFIHENKIMIMEYEHGRPRQLARASKTRAVSFHPDGQSVLFTDGKNLRKVNINDSKVTKLLGNYEFLEIDSVGKGYRIAATVRTLTGYKVRIFDRKKGTSRTVAKGCSASLSPDGNLITVNGLKHDNLYIYDWKTLRRVKTIRGAPGMKFDNQYWSNDARYIVATSEDGHNNIYIFDIETNKTYQGTFLGNCDRADLFIEHPGGMANPLQR